MTPSSSASPARRLLPLFFLANSLLLISLLPVGAQSPASFSQQLPIPPRLQWDANYGYCGETSFICAGLYYGQYCSQFTARQLASPSVPQSRENSQLLLGVNDVKAAQAMHLAATPWKTSSRSSSTDFLAWMESQILKGYPVVIGVFMNEYLFYRNTASNAGDSEYDHIVPVIGVAGPSHAQGAYNASDVLTFSDNGLWNPSGTPPYIFSSAFGDFQRTRKEANAKSGPVYSLKTGGPNYGIAFSGVLDLNKDTIPVRITTEPNAEIPAMKNKSNTAPAPSKITLTVTVTIPDQNLEYNLYRFNDFKIVPDSKFNSKAGKASAKWLIPRNSGPQYVLKLDIQSNETAVFRAVRTTAP